MTRGSSSLLSSQSYFWTLEDSFSHVVDEEKRVFIISEIKNFHFLLLFWEKVKKGKRQRKATASKFRFPPVNASECVVIYAFVAASLMTRVMWCLNLNPSACATFSSDDVSRLSIKDLVKKQLSSFWSNEKAFTGWFEWFLCRNSWELNISY